MLLTGTPFWGGDLKMGDKISGALTHSDSTVAKAVTKLVADGKM